MLRRDGCRYFDSSCEKFAIIPISRENTSHILSAHALLGLPAAPGPVGAVDVGVHGVVVVAKRVDPDVGGADENRKGDRKYCKWKG